MATRKTTVQRHPNKDTNVSPRNRGKTKRGSLNQALVVLCVGIFLLGLVPRYYDIMKFLPDYSIDENDVVEWGVGFMGGDLDPQWYKYGPLYAYMLRTVYRVQAVFYGGPTEAFVQAIFFNPTKFYYTARFINSCLNVLLAFLAFSAARRFFNRRVALIALLLGLFPFADILVNFKVRVDTLLAVWSTLAVYFAMGLCQDGTLRSYGLTGLFFGLALATKPLPALLILPTIFLAHLYATREETGLPRPEKVRLAGENRCLAVDFGNTSRFLFKAATNAKIWLFLGVGFVTNLIFHPYSILHFEAYKKAQIQAVLTEGQRAFLPGWDISRFFPLVGSAFTIACLAAIPYVMLKSFRTKDTPGLIMASFPLVFWLCFAAGAARNYFYVPIIPMAVVAISILIDDLSRWLGRANSKWQGAIVFVALLAIIAQPAISQAKTAVRLNSFSPYKQHHTTLAGKQWIEKNIAQGSRILLYGFYTSLPRLVDRKAEKQMVLGEYFMYHRWENTFLVGQFMKAHRKYVSNHNTTFNLENLRNLLGDKARLLFGYCKREQYDYVVTHYDLGEYPEFEKRVLKRFDRQHYPFGPEFVVYKMT